MYEEHLYIYYRHCDALYISRVNMAKYILPHRVQTARLFLDIEFAPQIRMEKYHNSIIHSLLRFLVTMSFVSRC